MNDHRTAVLALAIGEWSAAVTHLDVLAGTRLVSVPRGAHHTIQAELRHVCAFWSHEVMHTAYFDDARQRGEVIANARAWATEHQSEIDELTNRKDNA